MVKTRNTNYSKYQFTTNTPYETVTIIKLSKSINRKFVDVPYEFNEYIDATDSGLLDYTKNSCNIVTNAVLHYNTKMNHNLSNEDIRKVIIEHLLKACMNEISALDYEMVLRLLKVNQVRTSHGSQNRSFAEDMKFCHKFYQHKMNTNYCRHLICKL